jgi:hypothetical protein
MPGFVWFLIAIGLFWAAAKVAAVPETPRWLGMGLSILGFLAILIGSWNPNPPSGSGYDDEPAYRRDRGR